MAVQHADMVFPFNPCCLRRVRTLKNNHRSAHCAHRIAALAVAWCLLALAGAAQAKAPLNFLTGYGDRADPVVALTWGVLLVSIAVTIAIAVLLAVGLWHRPGIWTMQVLARVTSPATQPALTIEVTGRQWWWQIRYLSDDPSRSFTTANEIHIPAGVPVLFRLIGGDVIHSFWVPALFGKTDVIPGQTNETWLEARAPGEPIAANAPNIAACSTRIWDFCHRGYACGFSTGGLINCSRRPP
jgi:hypothetical protein